MVYVTMTDTFLSGWGPASDLINKLIFECENLEEARVVRDNAKSRTDMQRVNICHNKPSYYRVTHGPDYELDNYYVQIKTCKTYDSWYKPGFFRKG